MLSSVLSESQIWSTERAIFIGWCGALAGQPYPLQILLKKNLFTYNAGFDFAYRQNKTVTVILI